MLRKILINTSFSGVVPLVRMVITYIMAPLIVRALGNYDYGLWEMVFSVVGYMGLLDLGLTPAIVRYVARYHATDDKEELNRIYSTTLSIFVPIGALLAVALIIYAYLSPHVIMHSDDGRRYVLFFLLVAVQVFFNFMGNVYESFLEGYQKYKLISNINIGFMVGGTCINYYLLKNGGALLTFATASVCGYVIKIVIYWAIVRSVAFGRYAFRKTHVSRKTFRELFDFAWKTFVHSVALRISNTTDALLVGGFLGAAVVPFYTIPANLLNNIRSLVWTATRSFMPLFSQLDALDEKESSQKVFLVSSRYAVGIVLPAIWGACLVGPPFISLWIGKEFAEKGHWIIIIFAIAYTVELISPFSIKYLNGIGQNTYIARIGVFSCSLNLLVSVILVQVVGKEGVALGTLIADFVFTPYMLYTVCRFNGITVWEYFKHALAPVLIPFALFLAVLQLLMKTYGMSRIIDILAVAVISALFYLLPVTLFLMAREERGFIAHKLRSGLARSK